MFGGGLVPVSLILSKRFVVLGLSDLLQLLAVSEVQGAEKTHLAIKWSFKLPGISRANKVSPTQDWGWDER